MAAVKVLIVEDVPEMRAWLARLVAGFPGYAVPTTAANLWEARLELSRRKPDIVLLDEVLPGSIVDKFCLELQAQGVPFLLITEALDLARPLPPGALGRLGKPGWKSEEDDRKVLFQAFEALRKPGQKMSG